MAQGLSDKKNFERLNYIVDNEQFILLSHVKGYGNRFIVYRRDSHHMAFSYLVNLMRCEKNHTNMERMVEFDMDSPNEYHHYHHFISESDWDYKSVNESTILQTNQLMIDLKTTSGKPTGMLMDESSHLKKGNGSVGVARQYAGVAGKVDNCQVAVYCSLTNGENATLIDTALFLPEKWIADSDRCKKAKIPLEDRVFKTKPQLALEMIKSKVALGVEFDWIGGDGLYGHNSELTRGLDAEGLFYVLDIHKDETFYLSEPSFSIPPKSSARGRTPIRIKPDIEAIRADKYIKTLNDTHWEKVTIRKTAKGLKQVFAHKVAVWHWDGTEEKARERTLVITRTLGEKPEIKYSFSNGTIDQYTVQQYACFQCSRYWVERCFDDAKNELGLSGYQVRTWKGWQHHQSLVLMACLYVLKIRIEQKPDYELMSVRDARIMIIAHLFADQEMISRQHQLMLIRHKQRKMDIERHYRINTS